MPSFPLPNPKQARVLLNATHRWNLPIGATRSGKTFLQYILAPVRAAEVPKSGLCVLMAKTMGNVESNLLAPMRELYGERYISQVTRRRNVTVAYLFGREFLVLGGDNTLAIDRIRGKSIAYLMGDEGPTWPSDLLKMVMTRLDKPWSMADITGNPEYPRHPFKVNLIDRAGELDVYHETFTLDDNPNLDPTVKANLKRELQGVWYQRLILGKWTAAEGAIYDMITEENYYADEPMEGAAHIRPQGLEYLAARCVDIDHGTKNPFAILETYDDGETLWVDREYYYDSVEKFHRKSDVEYVADYENFVNGRFPNHEQDFPVASLQIDSEATPYIELMKQAGYAVKLPDKEVLAGIQRTSTMFTLRKIRIHKKNCPMLQSEIESYGWDENASAHGKEVPIDAHNHLLSALRYRVNSLPKWRIGVSA